MPVLGRFVAKTLEHGVSIFLAQLEELVRQRVGLVAAHMVFQLPAQADELGPLARLAGHARDECDFSHEGLCS